MSCNWVKKSGLRNADDCGEAAEVSRLRTMCTAYELGKRGGSFPERVDAAAVKDKIRSRTRTNLVQEKKYSDRLIEALRKYHKEGRYPIAQSMRLR